MINLDIVHHNFSEYSREFLMRIERDTDEWEKNKAASLATKESRLEKLGIYISMHI
jgi:hypothetical protein